MTPYSDPVLDSVSGALVGAVDQELAEQAAADMPPLFMTLLQRAVLIQKLVLAEHGQPIALWDAFAAVAPTLKDAFSESMCRFLETESRARMWTFAPGVGFAAAADESES